MLNEFLQHSSNYAKWVYGQITFENGFQFYGNYFWMLVVFSLVFIVLEAIKPWRKKQPVLRKDFWIDGFFMFFNFFLFGIIFHVGAASIVSDWLHEGLEKIGVSSLLLLPKNALPYWAMMILYFVFKDFIEWCTHRVLHKYDFLWRFHKVHHSIQEMGFAGHLRFHWMESIIYKSIQYIPLAMIGADLYDFFIIHCIAVFIGHWNHANFTLNIGPLKYLFNNPEMHIWHHAKEMPESHRHGVNFALSLSCWDYLFGTAYIPYNGRDIELGFSNIKSYPRSFWKLIISGFKKD